MRENGVDMTTEECDFLGCVIGYLATQVPPRRGRLLELEVRFLEEQDIRDRATKFSAVKEVRFKYQKVFNPEYCSWMVMAMDNRKLWFRADVYLCVIHGIQKQKR